MTDAVYEKVVDYIVSHDSFKVVGFTGGECTLDMDRLCSALLRFSERGAVTRIVTNGWWAKSEKSAKRFLDRLEECGLKELNTSFDAFHEPFIDLEAIARIVEGCLNRRIVFGISVIKDYNGKWDAEKVVAAIANILGLSLDVLKSKIFYIDDFPTPVGAAASLVKPTSDVKPDYKTSFGCTDIYHTLSFHPNGDVRICCGHACFHDPDLTIGNNNIENVDRMLARAYRNSAYLLIHGVGPQNILRKLGCTEEFVSVCDACHELWTKYRQDLLDALKKDKEMWFLRDVIFSDSDHAAVKLIVNQRKMIKERASKLRGVK